MHIIDYILLLLRTICICKGNIFLEIDIIILSKKFINSSTFLLILGTGIMEATPPLNGQIKNSVYFLESILKYLTFSANNFESPNSKSGKARFALQGSF